MMNLCSLYKTNLLAWLLAVITFSHAAYQFYTEGFSSDIALHLLMIGIIAAIIFYITQVKKYFVSMDKILAKWAVGNLEDRFTMISEPSGAGQMGEVFWKLNEFADAVDAFVRESTASMQAVSAEKYYRKIIIVGMIGAFKKGAISINEGVNAAHKKNKILVDAVADLEKNVTGILEDVKTASETVNKFCHELVSLSQDSMAKTKIVSSDSLQAQSNVDSVAASSNELSSAITEISKKVIESNTVVQDAMHKTEETSEKMQQLKALSQEVNNITSMISDIAEQTNLLALNATIESARAGEAGKGFAVVAGEVKNLAAQTVGATSEISSRLKSMQESVDGLVFAIQDVTSTIGRVSEISTIISAAVEEQSASTKEISHNMGQAASNTKRVTGNLGDVSNIVSSINSFSETVSDAANKLSERITILGNSLNNFKKSIKS